MKALVTISRKWHNPEITTTVWQHGENDQGVYVAIRMDMKDFIEALKIELQTDPDIDRAVEAVCDGMKHEWLKHPL